MVESLICWKVELSIGPDGEWFFWLVLVPTCTFETTLSGFSNSLFKHYCSHVGHFFYFIWWLLKEPFVCVKENIYSKKVQLCNGRILKTCVITICLRELLLYCQHNTLWIKYKRLIWYWYLNEVLSNIIKCQIKSN